MQQARYFYYFKVYATTMIFVLMNASPSIAQELPSSINKEPNAQKGLPTHATLYWDYDLSALVGTSVVHSSMEGYSLLWPHRGHIINRIAHSVVDGFFSHIVGIMQHEIFGHGFRLREVGFGKVKYGIFYALPGDAAKLMQLKKELPPKVFIQKESVIHAGGIESTQVLAQQMTLQCLPQQKITPIRAWLFLQGIYDGAIYVHECSPDGKILDDISVLARAIEHPDQESDFLFSFKDGFAPLNLKTLHAGGYLNDIRNYVAKINELYDDPNALSVQTVRNTFYLNLLNPFIAYSAYFIAIEYLLKGNTYWQYPMIPLGGFKYLPGMKCIMTPYGLETQLVNYIRYKDIGAQILLSYGQHATQQSYGIGGQCKGIAIHPNWMLGGRFYIWKQPQLFAKDPSSAPSQTGVMLTLLGEYTPAKYLGIVSQLGYKTQGYVQGEHLDAGPILGLGLALHVSGEGVATPNLLGDCLDS